MHSARKAPSSFSRLLRPRSIAVFGGSAAAELIRQCDRLGFEGEIWPVHPRKETVEGRRVFRSVGDLPGSPDASYVAVNRRLTVDIVRELAEKGAGGAVCFATGFNESGEEGEMLARALLAGSGDMPLVGPNCYGLLNYVDGAALWPDQQGARRVASGVAVICMSSNVAFNLTMQRRGLPIAYLLSLGNKLKFDLHDAIRAFADQDSVTAIGLYLEAISDPHAFADAVTYARELGKPVVALKSGRSDVAKKMVVSHTASLAGSDSLVSALLNRSGVARVDSMEALLEALKLLHVYGPLDGGRIGAMSTSGGDLALLADGMIDTPLELPPLPAEAETAVREVVHERMVAANPLDFQMFDWNDADRLGRMFAAFMGGGFDLTACVLDYPRADRCDPSEWLGAEHGFVNAVRQTGARGAVLSTFSDTTAEDVADRLIDIGIPVLAGIDAGLQGIRAAVEIGQAWKRPAPAPLIPAPAGPEHAPGGALDEFDAKAMLAAYGIRTPRGVTVSSAGEARKAADKLGYPLAVKALGIDHKTDAGGVHLGLDSADSVAKAVESMAPLGPHFLVEEMIEDVVAELIVGVARDEQFGPTLLLGAGGILVELVRDSTSLLLPTDRDTIRRTLLGLKCSKLLRGFRGRPPADVESAVNTVLAVAEMVAGNADDLLELDINPLLVLAAGKGAVAADALIRLRSDQHRPE